MKVMQTFIINLKIEGIGISQKVELKRDWKTPRNVHKNSTESEKVANKLEMI